MKIWHIKCSALLQDHIKHWIDFINTGSLNLSHKKFCILGNNSSVDGAADLLYDAVHNKTYTKILYIHNISQSH